MENTFSNLKPGDAVYVRASCGQDQFMKGVVKHVTPKGLIDVLVGHSTEVTRFRPNGEALGGSRYYRRQLDTVTVANRDAWLQHRERVTVAVNAINEVKSEYSARATWDKVSLMRAVDALELKLAEARKLTEAI